MSLKEKLKQLREEKGYSQAELARLSGISQPMICQYESAKYNKNPSIVNAYKLAKVFNISLDEFMKNTDV